MFELYFMLQSNLNILQVFHLFSVAPLSQKKTISLGTSEGKLHMQING